MKRNRKLLALTLSALMTAGLLAGCSAASSSTTETDVATSAAGTTAETANPGGEDGVFTIAYAPNESNTEAADARNGLAEDLGAVLGCKVEEIQASDYNAIIEALRTGSADMAYMGSQALALGVGAHRPRTHRHEGGGRRPRKGHLPFGLYHKCR